MNQLFPSKGRLCQSAATAKRKTFAWVGAALFTFVGVAIAHMLGLNEAIWVGFWGLTGCLSGLFSGLVCFSQNFRIDETLPDPVFQE